jgi:hypothetical protein
MAVVLNPACSSEPTKDYRNTLRRVLVQAQKGTHTTGWSLRTATPREN